MIKNIIFLIILLLMILNIFVFDLEMHYYYLLNSAIITSFILISFFFDRKNKVMKEVDIKILKLLTLISLLSLISQAVISLLMRTTSSSNLLISVFSIINTLIFIIYIFKYEFKRLKTN